MQTIIVTGSSGLIGSEMQDKIANFGAYCWPEVE